MYDHHKMYVKTIPNNDYRNKQRKLLTTECTYVVVCCMDYLVVKVHGAAV